MALSPAGQAIPQQRLFTNQQHFGVEEGLPQSFICGMLQDEDGFLWLATLDGLCRYDGRGFRTFNHDARDSTALLANVINNLERQRGNVVTVRFTSTQADDFDLRTFRATRNNTQQQVDRIPGAHWRTHRAGVSSANWFFMTGVYKGMGWLNSTTGKVHYANKANGRLQQDTISAIVESRDGHIFLVSENGVHVSDTSQSRFQWIPFATTVKPEKPGHVLTPYPEWFSIAALPRNRIAIADSSGITLLDVTKRSSKHLQIPKPAAGPRFPFNSSLQVDSKGRVYFLNAGRIFRINEKDELKLLWENTDKPSLRTTAFYIDRSEVLWVSVNAQGLLKIDLQASLFESYAYRTNFLNDIMEQAGVPPQQVALLKTYAEASYSFKHTRDAEGNIFFTSDWMGKRVLYRLGPNGLQPFTHYPKATIYSALTIMPGDAIWAFDQVSRVWYSWKSFTAMPQKVNLESEVFKGAELTDAQYIGGSLWMATEKHGLLQLNANKQVNSFLGRQPKGIVPENLTEICADPTDQNRFWIGSRGSGLLLWHVGQGLQRIYTTKDGLPNNTVYSILPDQAGRIWCSTNKGIFCFDAVTGQVTGFEKTDGLPGNEFNRAHKFMFADGRMAFGGIDGYCIFNPADFDSLNEVTEVPLFLTGLQVNNQAQDLREANSLVKEPLASLSSFRLPYNRNYLRFEFAALVFNQPQKTRYRYQLAGTDADWIENGTSNIAAYSALRPGSYTFRVNATGSNGQWSNTVKEISFVISPPFWATWWANLFYALLALGAVRWYFVFREGRLRAEQELAFEKREALRLKEMDETRNRFFSNVTHEFRTPLTLIISPLEKLGQDPSLSAAALRTVETARRNSKQLLSLINEFLDFSKLNDGQLTVKPTAGEPALFTADLVRSFEGAAREKAIALDFTATAVTGYYLFDEDKWGKIISNLLSNALKFTPRGGHVSVSLFASPHDGAINLEVKDNGPGIAAHLQEKVFDRFYQVDDSSVRSHGGTGIGLSLVKELCQLMKGSVSLQSEAGGPTRFTVSVPMPKIAAETMIPSVAATQAELQDAGMGNEELPLLLVAEDNDELRAFLAESLRPHYRLLEAADGTSAWHLVLQELPQLVISDVMMPGRDGFDLCRLCKADPRTAHIGFILLTAKAAHDARLHGLAGGADDYITKPFNLEELLLRTANLLHLQQKQREWLQASLLNAAPRQELPHITDPFLVELYREMDDKLSDPGLGVDQLCRAMAMSRSTLNRKLKALLDISANELIRQYRLQKGAALLSSGLDIASVAYQVGFSSPSYFSQCFREQYGLTPSAFISTQGLTQN